MKTFFNILQTLTNKKHKTYPDEPFILCTSTIPNAYSDEIYHIDLLIGKMFYEEKKSKHSTQTMRKIEAKFISLNSILENIFYTNELKERIFDIFSKSQKCYYAFSRLSQIYKTKKYPIVVSNDLMLNPLDIKHIHTFTLIENKSIYLFSLHDLVSIIESAISNSPNFFSYPLNPVNPYNKQEFTYSTLYNIYFKLKESRRLMSTLFHLFFLENFNKECFSENYEPIIREHSIKQYVFNSPYTILYSPVLMMLKSNPYTKNYNIHNEFPKDTLVTIFRPFLFYFFIINYDIKNTSKIYNYKEILYIKLKYFYNYNKAFGRQYIKLTTRLGKITQQNMLFNDKHINFYKIPIKPEIQYNEIVVVGISVINRVNNPMINRVSNEEEDEEGDEEQEEDEAGVDEEGIDDEGIDDEGIDDEGIDDEGIDDEEQDDTDSIS